MGLVVGGLLNKHIAAELGHRGNHSQIQRGQVMKKMKARIIRGSGAGFGETESRHFGFSPAPPASFQAASEAASITPRYDGNFPLVWCDPPGSMIMQAYS